MGKPEIVKTKTTRYEITNVAIDFLTFDENWRRIRKNRKYKGSQCYNCYTAFKDGEKMSLVFTNKGNKIVCRGCGESFKKELEV